MSARQMYSSSIKSPFSPSPPPALAAIPPGLCGGSAAAGADARLGWAPADFALAVPTCCFLLGVPQPLQPWDTSQCTCALKHPAQSHQTLIKVQESTFLKLPKQVWCWRAAARDSHSSSSSHHTAGRAQNAAVTAAHTPGGRSTALAKDAQDLLLLLWHKPLLNQPQRGTHGSVRMGDSEEGDP